MLSKSFRDESHDTIARKKYLILQAVNKMNDNADTVSLLDFILYIPSINMPYRDEDSRLDQKYEKQISWDLYYREFECRK